MNKMIAYCGLDCEHCDAYLATMNDDQELRKKTAKLWAELNNAPILPEHINCQGCRVEGVKTVFCDSMCGVRQCAMKKESILAATVQSWKDVLLLELSWRIIHLL